MGLDPIGIIVSIATNLATDIIKHYAERLNGTLVGRGLKEIGLLEKNQIDHLHEILKETLQLYFQTYSLYDISGVESFFRDPIIIQQIVNHIFDLRPLDHLVIEGALTRNVRNDALTMALMQRRGGQPEQIIPDFLKCYRRVLHQHIDSAERALLLTVLDATDIVVTEIRASEERLKMFTSETAHQQTQALRQAPPSMSSGQIIGRYRIQQHLADGRFGTLYCAEEQDNGVQVVLKVISVPGELRLKHDVFSVGENLKALRHPFILPTLDIQLSEMFPYVVSTYAEGGTLLKCIHQYAPQALPISEAIDIIIQIGEALAYLHQQHIIHRALQPACILFNNAGQVQLTGFDLAITEDRTKHHLQSNQAGVDGYMAPEQLRGVVSAKSDQYALGCIAYELFTGNLPFSETPHPSTPPHQIKLPVAPDHINPKITAQAGRAIVKALSMKPNQRYDSVEMFLAAITKH